MPRGRVRYASRDSGDSPMDRVTASMRAMQKGQISAYAGARFQEWEQNAPEREALLQFKLQKAQSDAELAGAQFRYNFWKDNELRRQTTAYYTAMPALQEQLRQNGIFPGSQRYAAEMSAFAAELPDAVTHNEAIRNDLKNYAKVDATSGQISEGIKTFKEGMQLAGETPGTIRMSKGGEISGEGSSKIPEPVLMRYGKLVGDIEEYAESDKARVSAAQKEKTVFETKYPELSNLLPATPTPTPTSAGNNLNPLQRGLIAVGLGKAPETQPTPQPTPSATPNLSDLAQRALNDPNATDEHKARARQLLGIQEENVTP